MYCCHVYVIQGYSPLGKGQVLEYSIVNTIAQELGKTPAQVVLRWGLQMSHSVVPKSSNQRRMQENFDLFDWSIPDHLLAKFSEIKQASALSSSPSLLSSFLRFVCVCLPFVIRVK